MVPRIYVFISGQDEVFKKKSLSNPSQAKSACSKLALETLDLGANPLKKEPTVDVKLILKQRMDIHK